jgi:hypothetical protein
VVDAALEAAVGGGDAGSLEDVDVLRRREVHARDGVEVVDGSDLVVVKDGFIKVSQICTEHDKAACDAAGLSTN